MTRRSEGHSCDTGRPAGRPEVTALADLPGADGAVAWAMVEASPDALVMADKDGVIELVNGQAEVLFGYDRGELLGRTVETLLPERFAKVHAAHRTRFGAAPEVRAMGIDLQLRARCADGTEVPVEVSLSPLHIGGELRIIAAVRDISDRVEAEAKLRLVQQSVDAVTDAVFMCHEETLAFTYVNQGAVDLHGYTRSELLSGMTPLDLAPGLPAEQLSAGLELLAAAPEESIRMRVIGSIKDGSTTPVEVQINWPARAHEGGPRPIMAVVRDIGEQVVAEERLAASEAAFRATFDAAPIGMATVDFTDTVHQPITNCNEALCELLGYSRDELLAKGLTDLTHPEDAARSDASAQEAAAGTVLQYAIEKRYIHADGHPVWVWVHFAVLPDEQGIPTRGLVQVTDLTARKRTEATQARLELLEDRERIGRDMHDKVIGRLFVTGMAVQSTLGRVADQATNDRLTRAVNEIDEAIKEIRTTIYGVRSQADWGRGTRGHILAIAADHNEPLGYEPDVEMHGAINDLPGPLVEELVASLRESLTNVVKHAQATRVRISVTVTVNEVTLTVADNGVGFEPSNAASESLRGGNGLANLVARAQSLGGQATITSALGDGTTVTWTAPLTTKLRLRNQ